MTVLVGSPAGLSGYVDGIGTSAMLGWPNGIAIDPSSTYALICECTNNRIRRLQLSTLQLTTLAGSGAASWFDNVGTLATFFCPAGIAIDNTGSFALVTDFYTNTVRKIALSTNSVVTIGTAVTSPFGITIHPSGAYALVLETVGAMRLWSVNLSTNVLSVVAGSAVGFADDVGTAARFNSSQDVVFAADGTYALIVDSGNQRIRRFDTFSGQVTSLAGSAIAGSVDGVGSLATFNMPLGLAIDPLQNFALVVDNSGNRIRKLQLGSACPGGSWCPAGTSSATGLGACNASFYCPAGSSSAAQIACSTAGFYCPAASSSQTACSVGFFLNTTGLSSNMSAASCSSGFYCPAGSSSPQQLACNVSGYFCPSASSSATQAACSPGSFCNQTGISSSESQLPCSAGFYCAAGSSSAQQAACSAGFYCNSTGQSSSAMQLPCSAGFYCQAGSSLATQFPCSAGYFCSPGSQNSLGITNTNGIIFATIA